MPSKSTICRRFMKENDPQNYEAYLARQRERGRRRRAEKKRKWQEEPRTKEMVEERERQLKMQRERKRLCVARKTGKPVTPRMTLEARFGDCYGKKPSEMSPNERRTYINAQRKAQRARQSEEKRLDVKKKFRDYMRQKRSAVREATQQKQVVDGDQTSKTKSKYSTLVMPHEFTPKRCMMTLTDSLNYEECLAIVPSKSTSNRSLLKKSDLQKDEGCLVTTPSKSTTDKGLLKKSDLQKDERCLAIMPSILKSNRRLMKETDPQKSEEYLATLPSKSTANRHIMKESNPQKDEAKLATMLSKSTLNRHIVKEKNPQMYAAYLVRQAERSKCNHAVKKKKWKEGPHTKVMVEQREKQLYQPKLAAMRSKSTLSRHIMKENDPQKYAAYLVKQKERSRCSRAVKKRKWQEEPHTKEMIEEKERQLKMQRERKRRCDAKKAGIRVKSKVTSEPGTSTPNGDCYGKRPSKMSPDERRAYENTQRKIQRARQSDQKKSELRKKFRDYMGQKRLTAKEAALTKLIVVYGDQIRKSMSKSSFLDWG